MIYEVEIPLKRFQDYEYNFHDGKIEPMLVAFKMNRLNKPPIDITEIYCQETGRNIASGSFSDIDFETIQEACLDKWEEILNDPKEYDNDDDFRGPL